MGIRGDTRCVTRRVALHFLVSIADILKPNECRELRKFDERHILGKLDVETR